jgi:drug/metabolite transporter (DMT)-like permease
MGKYSLFLILAAFLAGLSQILVKLALKNSANLDLSLTTRFLSNYFLLFKNIIFLGGLFGYGLATLIWLFCLTKVDLSFATPFLVITYVIIMIGSWLFIGETISIGRATGAMLVIAGLILINMTS